LHVRTWLAVIRLLPSRLLAELALAGLPLAVGSLARLACAWLPRLPRIEGSLAELALSGLPLAEWTLAKLALAGLISEAV
jgi:hypothetical protein